VSAVATSTCEKVSIAVAHSPMNPTMKNISAAMSAGRKPLSRYAIRTSPTNVAGHGVSMKKLRSGWMPWRTMKFPVGFVRSRKRNVPGFWM